MDEEKKERLKRAGLITGAILRAQLDDDICSLAGTLVLELRVNEDARKMRIITDQGTMTLETTSECCSSSYFSCVTGVSALLGEIVESVRKVHLREVMADDGFSHTKIYSIKIKTTGGEAEVEFRNESNGYYGGDISVVPEALAMCNETYREITEDTYFT